MTSTAEGVFREEQPTGKFESETLEALRARSLEKSTMFNASLDGPPVDLVTAPYPAATSRALAGPTPSSPEFLGKSTAVLVLPQEPAPAPRAAPTAPPPAPAGVAEVTPPPPAAAPVVRTHRRLSARALVQPRRRVWRHVVKLALLALVVVCQPWWWNVGDLTAAHRGPATVTTAK